VNRYPASGMLSYTYLESPIGPLFLAGDNAGMRQILFVNGRATVGPLEGWRNDPASLSEAVRQLRAYFAGELHEFDLPVAPEGTPFQLRIWRELQKIPYGETMTYGELARRVGRPNASRAVGSANGANPISIVIPCHRVIGSNGRLTGYGGGIEVKEKLLALEKRQLLLL